jgi:hypothetical protein
MCKLTRFIVDPSTSGATTRGYTSTHGRAPSLELWNTRHDSLWYPLSASLCAPSPQRPADRPIRAARFGPLSSAQGQERVRFFSCREINRPHAVHSTQISACVRASTRAAGRRSALLALYWPVYARVDIASNTTISLLLNRARRGIGRQPLTRTRAHTGRAA